MIAWNRSWKKPAPGAAPDASLDDIDVDTSCPTEDCRRPGSAPPGGRAPDGNRAGNARPDGNRAGSSAPNANRAPSGGSHGGPSHHGALPLKPPQLMQANPPHRQPPHNQPPLNQPPHNQPSHNQPPHGQPLNQPPLHGQPLLNQPPPYGLPLPLNQPPPHNPPPLHGQPPHGQPPTLLRSHSAGSHAGTNDAHRPPGSFSGAVLPICGLEVLIVVVRPWVLANVHEANLYVVAFHERFRRTIVLMAQLADGTPYFYGPAEVVRALRSLPFELIPWRRLLYRTAPPPSWKLPIPAPRNGSARTETIGSSAFALGSSELPTRAALPAGAEHRTVR